MDNLDNVIKNVFYRLVSDSEYGFTFDKILDSFTHIKFNYFDGNNSIDDSDYMGVENSELDYDTLDEVYNGTALYFPTLKVTDKELFFSKLSELVYRYFSFYGMEKLLNKFSIEDIIKLVIMSIFSNARYIDYENPCSFFDRRLRFFDDDLLDNFVSDSLPINLFFDSCIHCEVKKEYFGYETPYRFDLSIKNSDNEYFLPTINYAIDNDTCFIYSIQNKNLNEDNQFNKKIKRLLNKVNSSVDVLEDYDKNDTILGTTPSFIISLVVFLSILKDKGITKVRAITFLPDRYFDKNQSEEFDANVVQKNLTEKFILTFYRLKYHFPEIQIIFPQYDGLFYDVDIGDDLMIDISNMDGCSNKLLAEIVQALNKNKKNEIN